MTAQTAQEAASQEAASRCTLADVAEGGATAAPGKGQPDGDCRDEARHDDHEFVHAFDWIEASRIALVAAAAVAVWFRAWEPFPAVSVIGIAGLLIGGWPILREAFENILARRMTMELSMTIAIVAAAAIGQFFTALVITLFVLVAEVLERLTVGRGRTAIRDLLEFLPDEVSVRRAGAIRAVSAGELSIGEAVLVAPGGRIPVDGAVLSGHSFVDEFAHYRRIHAGREDGRNACLRGLHQPVRNAGGKRRADRSGYELWQDYRSRRARGAIARDKHSAL